jgi:hypothetical protein
MKFLFLVFLLWGCKTEEVSPFPLSEQIIKLRPDYKGLTYRYCSQKQLLSCEKYEVIEYKPSADLAKRLQDLKMVCKISGDRFKPCWQDQFGFCRVTYNGFWPLKKQSVIFMPLEGNEIKLMDSNLKCFNDQIYDFMSI